MIKQGGEYVCASSCLSFAITVCLQPLTHKTALHKIFFFFFHLLLSRHLQVCSELINSDSSSCDLSSACCHMSVFIMFFFYLQNAACSYCFLPYKLIAHFMILFNCCAPFRFTLVICFHFYDYNVLHRVLCVFKYSDTSFPQ